MNRDLTELGEREFDLLVVGAGIHGAAIAWDAVTRGLSVALIDKGDFVSGNSANSLKIIHGGLRYLQKADLSRMRQSIRERSLLLQMAPHLVHPLPCLLPTHGLLAKSKAAMWVALKINDLVSLDRNKNLRDPDKRIPNSRIVNKRTCLELAPGLDGEKITGGALWYDAQMYNAERLAFSFVLSAARAGAQVANYVAAAGFLTIGQAVTGLKVRDLISRDEFEIRARIVINCSGSGVDEVLALHSANIPRKIQPSTAMNIVVNREIVSKVALGIRSPFEYRRPGGTVYRGSRVLFMAPWRRHTLVGTRHSPAESGTDEMEIKEEHIFDFIDEINTAYPGANIKREEVTFYNWGVIPMNSLSPQTGEVLLTDRYNLIDHSREDGIDSLISLIGVKYTTGRGVAERAVDMAFRKLGLKPPKCKICGEPLAGGAIEVFDDFVQEEAKKKPFGLSLEVMSHLSQNYGTELNRVLKQIETNPEAAANVPGSSENIQAEIYHSVKEEMAQKLADVVFRRTNLGSGGNPGDEGLQACAAIMAKLLDWNELRTTKEIEEVKNRYPTQ